MFHCYKPSKAKDSEKREAMTATRVRQAATDALEESHLNSSPKRARLADNEKIGSRSCDDNDGFELSANEMFSSEMKSQSSTRFHFGDVFTVISSVSDHKYEAFPNIDWCFDDDNNNSNSDAPSIKGDVDDDVETRTQLRHIQESISSDFASSSSADHNPKCTFCMTNQLGTNHPTNDVDDANSPA